MNLFLLNSGNVSPPPPSRIMTGYSLTERKTAFIGPHHISKDNTYDQLAHLLLLKYRTISTEYKGYTHLRYRLL